MPRLDARITDDEQAALVAYCEKHGLNRSQAVRVALGRLMKKAPTAQERADSELPVGNPTFRQHLDQS